MPLRRGKSTVTIQVRNFDAYKSWKGSEIISVPRVHRQTARGNKRTVLPFCVQIKEQVYVICNAQHADKISMWLPPISHHWSAVRTVQADKNTHHNHFWTCWPLTTSWAIELPLFYQLCWLAWLAKTLALGFLLMQHLFSWVNQFTHGSLQRNAEWRKKTKH